MDFDAYVLGRLSDDDCWSILKEKAIVGQEVQDELEAIKDTVIKRCGGLPIAACVMGGFLSLKKRGEWRSILENQLFNLSGVHEEKVMQVLKLSFDNLPSPSIKKCFAYCSLFPKDSYMERDMLIELWMAEGFLQTDLKDRLMEETGMSYLRILLPSSLFEETINTFEGTYHYKMHDLVHDLAVFVSKSTKIIKHGESDIIDESNNLIRYLAVDSSGEEIEKLFKSLPVSLHTLFLRTGLPGHIAVKLKKLHVLDFDYSHRGYHDLLIPFEKLIHLRYLNLTSFRSKTLPECICKLYNLQTLRLNSDALKSLPKGLRNLISLRHLHYRYPYLAPFQMPIEMGRLTCLQTLEFFNVGQEKGWRIGELGCLRNLKGGLEICCLQRVRGREDAKEANLFEKTNLRKLRFEWAVDREGDNFDEDVLDGLQPYPDLEELTMFRFMGDQFPAWVMNLPSTLPKLLSLRLNECKRCRELPSLRNLENLRISGCHVLTILPGDMLQSCTSLQSLCVSNCQNLTSVPLDLRQMPSLSDLTLLGCPKLRPSMTPKGFGFLTNLRKLWIGPFLDDDDDDHVENSSSSIYKEFDWSGLISSSSSTLRELQLYGLPHMESLPHQLQYLTSLTSIFLSNFGGIEALPEWFGNFTVIESLYLVEFNSLAHLPSEDAMRRLTRLSFLCVDGSPLLKERCIPDSRSPDSEWSKVSHIEHLTIDG